MNKHLALIILLFLAVSSVGAQPVLNARFNSYNFAGYFERVGNGVSLGVLPDGKKCLRIDGAVGSLTLKPIPVKPLQKYKLTIRAAIVSKDTIESNDRIPEFSRKTSGRSFSSYTVTFLDKEGQTTGLKLRDSHLVDNSGVIISSKANDFVHVFYSPGKVTKMRLDLKTRKNTLLIESIKLELEKDEGTVNCNPDFRYGELSPSGWRPDLDGRLYRCPDGKTILKSGYGASSGIFVVNDYSKYSFYCKGAGYNGNKGKTTLSFYDENGNRKGSIHLFWGADMKDGATKKGVMPPPGTFQAQVDVSSALFQELRVTKDK